MYDLIVQTQVGLQTDLIQVSQPNLLIFFHKNKTYTVPKLVHGRPMANQLSTQRHQFRERLYLLVFQRSGLLFTIASVMRHAEETIILEVCRVLILTTQSVVL